MKVSAVEGIGPSPRGHAYGLVRQLQEGTFKGASIEKHQARYADRLQPETPPAGETVPGNEEAAVIAPPEEPSAAETSIALAPEDTLLRETVAIFGGLGTYVDTLA